MNEGEILHLVIIEETGEKAESHALILRNAGLSFRSDSVHDLGSLKSRLDSALPDMVICGEGPGVPDLQSVRKLLNERGADIPLIPLVNEASVYTASAARNADTNTLVSYAQAESLLAAVSRGQESVLLRRKIESLEQALMESELICHALMETCRDATACLRDGRHVYTNDAYRNIFGYARPEELADRPLLDLVDPEHRESFSTCARNHDMGDNRTDTLEIRCIHSNGDPFDAVMELSAASAVSGPRNGLIIRIRPRTGDDRTTDLDALTRQDLLTGLANRQTFMRVLEEAISNGNTGQAWAVIYILLDNFKIVREDIGVAGSDRVINCMARLVEEAYPDADTVARFSDCVFTILHHGESDQEILQRAEILRQNIEKHVLEIGGRAFTTTCSVGICIINEHSHIAENVLSRADLACEVARSSGGNGIHVHSTAVDAQMDGDHEHEWDEMIRTTIDKERFYLVYQPIVSLNDHNGAQRYEVLLRIVDDQGHIILPGQFISIAEKIGMSGEIDRWVIRTALKSVSGYSTDTDITLFIKISCVSLIDAEFPAWIGREMKEHQVKPDRIIFEIPENAAIADMRATLRFANALKVLRCSTAIEHFGRSGQPQLIDHLPVDIIKIDGSLVDGMVTNKDSQKKIQSIVETAHKVGKQCIAERVDNTGSLATLWQFGVDYIQGNFVQEPSRDLAYDFESEVG